MADVALAVKPGGKWAAYVGKKVYRPLPFPDERELNHREQIPIIADDAVEEGLAPVFGLRPHDKTDYEIGKRHNLPFIDILTPNGMIKVSTKGAFVLNGMERFKARICAAQLLGQYGLLAKEVPYENTVGFSERANVPIEPRSQQWFLKYPKIPEALALLRDGHVRFIPRTLDQGL